MKKIFMPFILIAMVIVFLTSCNKELEEEQQFAEVTFGMDLSSQKKRVGSKVLGTPAKVYVIITPKAGGSEIHHEIALMNMNGSYMSLPITIAVGDYNLQSYTVLDSENQTIYATPKKGSPAVGTVTTPLPMLFRVPSNSNVIVSPQVVSVAELTCADLGYESFPLDDECGGTEPPIDPPPADCPTIDNTGRKFKMDDSKAYVYYNCATQEEWDRWNKRVNYEPPLFQDDLIYPMTQSIYNEFDDEFDFIFFVNAREDRPTVLGYYGQLSQVKSDVTGIGLDGIDFAADYGSAGNLNALMHLPYIGGLTGGPVLHELMHTWGNFILMDVRNSVTDCATQPNVPDEMVAPHWGYTGHYNVDSKQVGGQLGGFGEANIVEDGAYCSWLTGSKKYTVNKFGHATNTAAGPTFSELELYLMGLMAAEDVRDFSVFTEMAYDCSGSSNCPSFPSSGNSYFYAKNRTIKNVVRDLPQRVPAAGSSEAQKEWKQLTVVVLPPGATLSSTQDTEITNAILELEKDENSRPMWPNFHQATGGRGDLDCGELNCFVKTTVTKNAYRKPIVSQSEKRERMNRACGKWTPNENNFRLGIQSIK